MANPIILAIAAIAGGVYLIYRHWDSIGPYFQRLWDGVKSVISTVWEWIRTAFAWSPLGVVAKHWDGIGKALSSSIDTAKGLAQEAWDRVKGIFSADWLPQIDTATLSAAIDTMTGIVQRGWDTLSRIFDSIVGAAVAVGEKVGESISAAVSGAQAALSALGGDRGVERIFGQLDALAGGASPLQQRGLHHHDQHQGALDMGTMRRGIVVDGRGSQVRVQFDEHDGALSPWLDVAQPSTIGKDVAVERPRAGYVNISPLMDDGAPNEEERAALRTVFDGSNIHQGDYIQIFAPTPWEFSFTLQLTVNDPAAMAAASSAVQGVLDGWERRLSGDIAPSDIVRAARSVSGVIEADVPDLSFAQIPQNAWRKCSSFTTNVAVL